MRCVMGVERREERRREGKRRGWGLSGIAKMRNAWNGMGWLIAEREGEIPIQSIQAHTMKDL